MSESISSMSESFINVKVGFEFGRPREPDFDLAGFFDLAFAFERTVTVAVLCTFLVDLLFAAIAVNDRRGDVNSECFECRT